MKIATFNVNSIKARLGNVLDWLKAADPDIALLQEIKCAEQEFPGLELSGLGYRAALVGQKTYNGVAILAKQPIEVDLAMLGGDDADDAARYIEGRVGGLRVASIYVPNGQNVGSDKFQYKLGFLARLEARIKELLRAEEAFVLGGDYNIAPFDIDVHDPKAWRGQIMVSPEERWAQYLANAWWLAFWPGLAIILTTLSLNLLSNWLRIALDPAQRWRLEIGGRKNA